MAELSEVNPPMPRPGHAASRGYGHAHRKRVADLKAAMRDGDPCCRCQLPMYRSELALLDGDHVTTPRVLGAGDPAHRDYLPDALAHRSCNRSHGAALGNRLRAMRRHDTTTTTTTTRQRDDDATRQMWNRASTRLPRRAEPHKPRAWLTDDEP